MVEKDISYLREEGGSDGLGVVVEQVLEGWLIGFCLLNWNLFHFLFLY